MPDDDAALDAVEARWERSVPLPEVTPALLDEHLAPWPELATRSWEVMSGGLRHLNLRSDELVLRIALESPESLAKEAALLRQLAETVRVPGLVGSSERALLLEYVPHAPLPPSEAAGRKVGRAAARIHALGFDRAGMLSAALRVDEPFPSALEGLRAWVEPLLAGPAGQRLGPARAASVLDLWDANHEAMAAEAARPVLVHSDFKPTNVKWLPESGDVLVLDWEFAWSGPALFDVGMMLRWSPPEPFVEGLAAGLLEGGAVLPERWRRLAELFDLFNLVGFLDGARSANRDRDVVGRVAQTLASNA